MMKKRSVAYFIFHIALNKCQDLIFSYYENDDMGKLPLEEYIQLQKDVIDYIADYTGDTGLPLYPRKGKCGTQK